MIRADPPFVIAGNPDDTPGNLPCHAGLPGFTLRGCYNVGERSRKTLSIFKRKIFQKDAPLPQINYKHEKRQKELEKKKKRAEKIRLKEIKKNVKPEENPVPSSEEK